MYKIHNYLARTYFVGLERESTEKTVVLFRYRAIMRDTGSRSTHDRPTIETRAVAARLARTYRPPLAESANKSKNDSFRISHFTDKANQQSYV